MRLTLGDLTLTPMTSLTTTQWYNPESCSSTIAKTRFPLGSWDTRLLWVTGSAELFSAQERRGGGMLNGGLQARITESPTSTSRTVPGLAENRPMAGWRRKVMQFKMLILSSFDC